MIPTLKQFRSQVDIRSQIRYLVRAGDRPSNAGNHTFLPRNGNGVRVCKPRRDPCH